MRQSRDSECKNLKTVTAKIGSIPSENLNAVNIKIKRRLTQISKEANIKIKVQLMDNSEESKRENPKTSKENIGRQSNQKRKQIIMKIRKC